MRRGVRLVLASESPRRRGLLESAGIVPIVVPPGVDEDVSEGFMPPEELVKSLARWKVRGIVSRMPDEFVMGGDTVVFIDGEVLGKPKDEDEARRMLRRIAGRTHEVYSGIALYEPVGGRILDDYDATKVSLREMDEEEIDWYVRTGEPMDKAGSYALQGIGCLFVTRVEGDFTGVVGLPLPKVYALLRRAGIGLDEILTKG